MSSPGELDVRPLTADDNKALAQFSCRSFAEPWTDLVQEMIREQLAAELRLADDIEARGLWMDDRLVGVVAWRLDPASMLCQSIVLAVEIGHRRRGYARRLKQVEIDWARRAGARAIASTVHWDNDPMIELNGSLGGSFTPLPDDPMHLRCIIPL